MSIDASGISARRLKWANRRNVGEALAILSFGVLALQATTQVWYSVTAVTNDATSVLYLTPQQLSTVGLLPAPAGMVPAVYTVFGMNAPQAWLLVATVLGITSVMSRLGILSLFGIGAAWMGRSAFLSMQSNIANSEVASQFARWGDAASHFSFWTWLVLAALLLSAVRITYAGHLRRRASLAAGEEVPANLLDTFHAVQASAVTRMSAPKTSAPVPGKPAQTTS